MERDIAGFFLGGGGGKWRGVGAWGSGGVGLKHRIFWRNACRTGHVNVHDTCRPIVCKQEVVVTWK